MEDQNALQSLLSFLKEQAPVFGTKADPMMDFMLGGGGTILGGLLGAAGGNPLAGALGGGLGGTLASKTLQQVGRATPPGAYRYDEGNPLYYLNDPLRQAAYNNPLLPGLIKAGKNAPKLVWNAAKGTWEWLGDRGQETGSSMKGMWDRM